MKKYLSTIAFLVLTNATFSQTLEIKTNPVGFAFGVTNLGLEYAFPKDPTFSFSIAGWHISEDLKEWSEIEWNAGASIGIRKYVISKSKDKGLYMGIAARYIDRDRNSERYVGSDSNGIPIFIYEIEPKSYCSAGFTLGYKQVFSDKFTIDAVIGVGRILWREDNGSIPAEFISGFNFGYRF